MPRGLLVVVSSVVLLTSGPFAASYSYPQSGAGEYLDALSVTAKLLLAILSLLEINDLLNRWAENRWMLRRDTAPWAWGNELAVVTGGSRGIGAEVARKLASYGIKVAILDLVPPSNDLYDDGATLIAYYECDITSKQAVQKAGQTIRLQQGVPSILINNAGIGNANSILEVTPERLRTIFDVNLLSQWNTVQEFLPGMLASKKGHIMSTASMAAFLGLAGMVDYSCTKAGLIAFYEGLTQELKHRYHCPSIKTSIVYPNWTKTRLISAIEKGIRSTKGPVIDPKDVAAAMVKQIITARSGQIVLGPEIAASVRALPTWLQELIRDRMAQVVTVNATSAGI